MAIETIKLEDGRTMEINTATGKTHIYKNKTFAQKKKEAATVPLQGEGKKVVQEWLDTLGNVPPVVKKQAYIDAMKLAQTKGITSIDNLTKDQIDILRNALGNYYFRAIEWKKYYPNIGTATAPTATAPTATAPTATAPTATKGRQNLTFADMLKDLGLSGKEQANPEVLKKVNDWLARRPGYKPGIKTNAYIKALQDMPTEQRKEEQTEIPKDKQSKVSVADNGYIFKNKGLYRDAMRAYKAGASTFVGNDGNAEFFNKYDVSKFTVSDSADKYTLNPNIISALTSRF